MGLFDEFQEFAVKGQVMDMAVGVMIGAAFATVVQSLVDDVLMPPIGLLTGGIDMSEQFLVIAQGDPAGPYASLAGAQAAGAVLVRYGVFANAIVSFLIVAVVLFVVVRWANQLRSPDTPPAPQTRPCPACTLPIHQAARRCPHCTSDVVPLVSPPAE